MNLEETLPLLIPIIALMIPIVAIMSKHQLKMAQIVNSQQDYSPELMAIRQELASLRDQMNRQALSIDNLERTQRSLPESQGSVST